MFQLTEGIQNAEIYQRTGPAGKLVIYSTPDPWSALRKGERSDGTGG